MLPKTLSSVYSEQDLQQQPRFRRTSLAGIVRAVQVMEMQKAQQTEREKGHTSWIRVSECELVNWRGGGRRPYIGRGATGGTQIQIWDADRTQFSEPGRLQVRKANHCWEYSEDYFLQLQKVFPYHNTSRLHRTVSPRSSRLISSRHVTPTASTWPGLTRRAIMRVCGSPVSLFIFTSSVRGVPFK
jgi:hypothetical protein